MKKTTAFAWLLGITFVAAKIYYDYYRQPAVLQPEPTVVTLQGKTMGTTYHVKYVEHTNPPTDAATLHADIGAVLKDVNNKMSTYQTDSEISRFNQYQTVDIPVEISADFATVLSEAIRLNQLTEGALDITVGPVVNLWGFGPEKRPERQPTVKQLAERQAWIGLDKITLRMENGKSTLTKHIPQVYLDLSSIAKGFGVDKVAGVLEHAGIADYMVEIGGEIRAKGKNQDGTPWRIAIEKPDDSGQRAVENIVNLDNAAMATSGDYRIYFEQDGKRFSHEINPKTGRPIEHRLASITVFAPTSMTADGLSTGLFVLGEQKALEIAEQQGIPVYLIIKTDQGFTAKTSTAFEKLMQK